MDSWTGMVTETGMEIRILGAHNCESSTSKFASLLIDDVLAIDAGGLTSSLSFEAQQKLKAVLLTHQHYDHIRDIPALAMNLFLRGSTITVYSIQPTYEAVSSCLLDGKLYPRFMEQPEQEPTIRFTVLEPYRTEYVGGYSILPVPVTHSVAAVGYLVTSPDGKVLFYTGDTGPGLIECWRHVSPQLLVIEVTAPSTYGEFARQSGHLTPSLLERELISFRELKGYLPRVVLVHMNPDLESEIAGEVAALARTLDCRVVLATEGMRLHL